MGIMREASEDLESCPLDADVGYRFYPAMHKYLLPLMYRHIANKLQTSFKLSLVIWTLRMNTQITDTYCYGLAVASSYVGMARKQDGGSNQCISVFTAISSLRNKC